MSDSREGPSRRACRGVSDGPITCLRPARESRQSVECQHTWRQIWSFQPGRTQCSMTRWITRQPYPCLAMPTKLLSSRSPPAAALALSPSASGDSFRVASFSSCARDWSCKSAQFLVYIKKGASQPLSRGSSLITWPLIWRSCLTPGAVTGAARDTHIRPRKSLHCYLCVLLMNLNDRDEVHSSMLILPVSSGRCTCQQRL